MTRSRAGRVQPGRCVLDGAADVLEQTACARQVICVARPVLAKLNMITRMTTTRPSTSWSRQVGFGTSDLHGAACTALEHDEGFGVVLDRLGAF